ncbi:glycosyltransferase [Lichenihabitans sp. Uapishka_5]|uniref:glycosyltransferase n=1 Tax=Lichenihabitans sp. Uapishka_5 TaxID=3037302 RepID=UPI0029E7F28B|nr:glycosyltransferase [Lichenihabitans sp. Uapishka_5]MDX7952583.1 glycosyltransferase [Lichenihabitans sp. Uapishka_5]
MIFVTVGVQLPFDRLIEAMDRWAGERGRTDVVAQAGSSAYRPQHLTLRKTLAPAEFRRIVEEAELVVAHAGMGSIITALELGKRIVVMPRRADLGEHRNDHQLSTARYMAEQNLVTVAPDATELVRLLDEPAAALPQRKISRIASAPLINKISDFLDAEATRRGLGVPARPAA